MRFMREDEASKAMRLFEGGTEAKGISKRALKNWVVLCSFPCNIMNSFPLKNALYGIVVFKEKRTFYAILNIYFVLAYCRSMHLENGELSLCL